MSRHSARGKRWRLFCRMVKQLAGYKCQRCGSAGRLEVHHLVSLGKGGSKYDPENVKVLCRRCHFGEHRSKDPVRAEWWRLIEGL